MNNRRITILIIFMILLTSLIAYNDVPKTNEVYLYTITGFENYRSHNFYLVTVDHIGLTFSKITGDKVDLDINSLGSFYISWADMWDNLDPRQRYYFSSGIYSDFKATMEGNEFIPVSTIEVMIDKVEGDVSLDSHFYYRIEELPFQSSLSQKYSIVKDITRQKQHDAEAWVNYKNITHSKKANVYSIKNSIYSDNMILAFRSAIIFIRNGRIADMICNYERITQNKPDKIHLIDEFIRSFICSFIMKLLILFLLFLPVCHIPASQHIKDIFYSCLVGNMFSMLIIWLFFPMFIHGFMIKMLASLIFASLLEGIIYSYFLATKLTHGLILSALSNLSAYIALLILFYFYL